MGSAGCARSPSARRRRLRSDWPSSNRQAADPRDSHERALHHPCEVHPGRKLERCASGGGFLRYVQHRDLHTDSNPARSTPDVSGLLKYVAYRDRANTRAELFGPEGRLRSQERKDFAEFVAWAITDSRPQPYQTRDGQILDRRRAVSRFVISPERSQGLDLGALTRAAVGRLESEMRVGDLRWIAAIHRNTSHHHVHLVLAGMVADGAG